MKRLARLWVQRCSRPRPWRRSARRPRPAPRSISSRRTTAEVVHGPVTVRFGLKGMGVAPAGVKVDNTGHHHLLVDTDLSELKLDAPLPATDKVVHFGKGQTETVLTLSPGSTRSSWCLPTPRI